MPKKNATHTKKRRALGMCVWGGCPNLSNTWYCRFHQLKINAYHRQRRAKISAAKREAKAKASQEAVNRTPNDSITQTPTNPPINS